MDALRQSLRTVCVTGTNGKTSTTRMIASIVEAAGEVPAHVTTLGASVGGETVDYDGSMSAFRAFAERAVNEGAGILAVETTSRALAGGFATRWPPDVAVFTNLSRDHLDRHGSPEAYLAAKARLFFALPKGGVAVLNAADPACALVAETLPPHVAMRGFAVGDATAEIPTWLCARELHATREGTRAMLEGLLASALGSELTLSIPGPFQIDNAIAAAIAADALGLPPDAIRRGLSRFAGVPGRFEPITRRPLVLVDYAHTPDALERTLSAARPLAESAGGQLFCVFGCGGDRDQGKREVMGAVADRLADQVLLTTDNPRSEDPVAIALMVRRGARGQSTWKEEPDRQTAIEAAMTAATEDDVVVIAGRGHEAVQHLGSGPVPFSDAAVARRTAERLGLMS